MKIVYALLSFIITFASASAYSITGPTVDFSQDRDVQEAKRRVVKSASGPIQTFPPQAHLVAESCGVAGCAQKYLVTQTIKADVEINVQSGSVAAIVEYLPWGALKQVQVILEIPLYGF